MRVAIRVKPGSSRAVVAGSYGDGELVVAVQQRAVDGKATEAALAALADALGLRRRDVVLVTGATSRTKLIELPDDDGLAARVAALLTGDRNG